MNTFSTILIGALLLVHQAFCGDVPDVKSIDCSETEIDSSTIEKCLVVSLNGDPVAYAGLVGIHKSDQVLEGTLYGKDGKALEDTHVSVTLQDGEQDTHVIILIMEEDDQLSFEMDCDLTTGTCKDHPVFIGTEGEEVDKVVLVPESDRLKEKMAPIDRQNKVLPPNGFKLKVQVMYDQSFATKYNNDVDQIRRAIDAIFVHANSYYKLKSLTTKIELDTTGLPYHALEGTYTASDNSLNLLRPIIRSFPREANSYTVLSYEYDMGGTAGIAYLGTTCNFQKEYRLNINEYHTDDMKSAAILVHEIGHNLGMAHDFGTAAGGHVNTDVIRFSTAGEQCSKVEGFMDYYGQTTKWSPCSIEDFTKYYNQVYSWCLPELGGGASDPYSPW